MRKFIEILLLINCMICHAQIPSIKNNQTENEKKESIIYNLYNGKQDFLIAYTTQSIWWTEKIEYDVLAYQNNQWEKFRLKMKKRKNGKFSKPYISKRKILLNAAKLINELTLINFWKLENDTLNITKVRLNDTVTAKYSTYDGVNFRFEILSKDSFRIIEAYEPDYFLEKMPQIKQRKIFIDARNKWDNNGS